MEDRSSTRPADAGLTSSALVPAATAMTTLAVGYVVICAATGWEPRAGWLLQALVHVGELLVVLALAASRAAGSGAAARLGLLAAVAGQGVLVLAEVCYPLSHAVGDLGFAVGPLLTGTGLVAAGVAVLRAGRLTGGAGLLPLTVGVYVFVVLGPAMAATGGPPAVPALLAIGVWDLLWMLTAAALWTARQPATEPLASRSRTASPEPADQARH